MLLREFYSVISNEEETAKYLLEKEIIKKVDCCIKCNGQMNLTVRMKRGVSGVVWRCQKKGCQTIRSARVEKKFFRGTKLGFRKIIELVFLWTMELSVRKVHQLTGVSVTTVTKIFKRCRNVCSETLNKREKMRGTHEDPIQIDEARFAGRRKYNRGRLLTGDSTSSENSPESVDNNRNHGRRIDGPWVFGLLNGEDVRYFYIEKRNASTLLSIIHREVASGSTIHSDEWPAYRKLSEEGFNHLTVNHQKNFVNPTNGCNTQKIERSWLESKKRILSNKRGVLKQHIQSHLDEICWRYSKGKNPDLFLELLQDIKMLE